MAKKNLTFQKNTYDNWILSSKRYYDFILNSHPINSVNDSLMDTCNNVTINPNISFVDEYGNIYSATIWSKSENTDVILKDYGLCSVDDNKTNINFYSDDLDDVFLNTTLVTGTDRRFKMSKIGGNFYTTPPINYDCEILDDNGIKIIHAMGGGFSGTPKFYMPLSVGKYQTLPVRVEQNQTFEFMIKPQKEILPNTLSYYNPNNFGFFFYYGQRENKWLYYTLQKKQKTLYEKIINNEGVILDTNNYIEFESNNKYLYVNNSCCGYRLFNNNPIPEDIIFGYQEKNKELNYYLLFNRTVDDFNQPKGLTVTSVNPLSQMNCCGYSSGELDILRKKYKCDSYLQYNMIEKDLQNFPQELQNVEIYDNSYDYLKDISNNGFGFRITTEGAIGYRTIKKNCNDDKMENPVIVSEQYSQNGLILWEEWNHLIIKIQYHTPLTNPECSSEPSRKGILYAYLNGNLVWVTKDWEEPIIHELNTHWSLQEGTLNMNLMVGSTGLMETILSDNPEDYPRLILPTEKYFGGNLIGDLRFFKMYSC